MQQGSTILKCEEAVVVCFRREECSENIVVASETVNYFCNILSVVDVQNIAGVVPLERIASGITS